MAIERSAYLADKSVTPYPLVGWAYVAPTEDVEAADGVRFVCGTSDGVEWAAEGCGDPFYLSYVRYVDGEAVEAEPEAEYVRLAGPGPRGPPEPGP